MKNNISKITLISTLLLSNMATAKNFYTCVPKESYIKNIANQTRRSDEEIRNLARETKRSDEEIRNLARETKRSDEEVRNLARETKRSDEEVRNLARQVSRTDSEIKNLIKQNAVSMECKTYHIKNDKEYLANMTGINIVRYGAELFLCSKLEYLNVGYGYFVVVCKYELNYDGKAGSRKICGDSANNLYVEVCKLKHRDI